MPLPRMTTRRWMVAVAVVAILSIIAHWIEGGWYRWQARSHAGSERYYQNKSDTYRRFGDRLAVNGRPEAKEDYADADRYEKRARWHRELRIKYDRAARWPWLPVPPDRPEPK